MANEVDHIDDLPPNEDGTSLPTVELQPQIRLDFAGYRPGVFPIPGSGLIYVDRSALHSSLLVSEQGGGMKEIPPRHLRRLHPEGGFGYREREVVRIADGSRVVEWEEKGERDEIGFFDLMGRLWTATGGVKGSPLRVSIRTEVDGWGEVVSREYEAVHETGDLHFEATSNPNRVLLWNCGNYHSVVLLIELSDRDLGVSELFRTEDPVPLRCAPVFDPGFERYLLADGSFETGVSVWSFPDRKKEGAVPWPGSALGHRSECGYGLWWLDRDSVLAMNSQGRLFLLDAVNREWICEYVIKGHPIGDHHPDFEENRVIQRSSLTNLHLLGDTLMTHHVFEKAGSDHNEFCFYPLGSLTRREKT